MRLTFSARRFATKTEPPDAATDVGSSPTGMRAVTLFELGSMRNALPACVTAQMSRPSHVIPAPEPIRIDDGSGIVAVTRA